jgi:hypothetical protein
VLLHLGSLFPPVRLLQWQVGGNTQLGSRIMALPVAGRRGAQPPS